MILGGRFAYLPRAFSTAVDALLRHPMRAGLTGFGVLVGVLSVTLVIALGEGAERNVEKSVESLGENLIVVRPKVPDSASGTSKDEAPRLTLEDARAVAAESRAVVAAAPVLESTSRIVFREKNEAAQALGVTKDYFVVRNYSLGSGTYWDENHEKLGARVCLLGSTLAKSLFGSEDGVGQYVRIGSHLFRVLGILAEKGQAGSGMDQDTVVVMPIATMRSKLLSGRVGDVSQIFVAGAKGSDNAALIRDTGAILRQRHGIGAEADDDFDVRDQAKMAESQRSIVKVMRVLLLSIAGLTLVIAGIGVTNIMMVSVTERSREIGTRLAIGARAADVLGQFLIESVLLCLLGGSFGVGLAFLAVGRLGEVFGYALVISPAALTVATVTSLTLGLVFGYLPARRAAKMDPVEALRKD